MLTTPPEGSPEEPKLPFGSRVPAPGNIEPDNEAEKAETHALLTASGFNFENNNAPDTKKPTLSLVPEDKADPDPVIPSETPTTLSQTPTDSAEPTTLIVELPEDPKPNPTVAIPAAATPTVSIPTTPTAPVATNTDNTVVESDDKPQNENKPLDNPHVAGSPEDKMGPTWLDALLYAIRHAIQLGNAVVWKIGEEDLKARQAGSSLGEEMLKRFLKDPKQFIENSAMILEQADKAGPEVLKEAGLAHEEVNTHATTLGSLVKDPEALKNAVTTLEDPNSKAVLALQKAASALPLRLEPSATPPTETSQNLETQREEPSTPPGPKPDTTPPNVPEKSAVSEPEPTAMPSPRPTPRPELGSRSRVIPDPEKKESLRASNTIPEDAIQHAGVTDATTPQTSLLLSIQRDLKELAKEPAHDVTSPITNNQPGPHPDRVVVPQEMVALNTVPPLKALPPELIQQPTQQPNNPNPRRPYRSHG